MQFFLFYQIIINLTILIVFLFYTCSASTFTSYTISGCSVKLRWNLTNTSRYEIYITRQNSRSYFQIQTSEHTFVFVAESQGVNYNLKWTPIYNIQRGNISEDHTVYIAKGKVESCKTDLAF